MGGRAGVGAKSWSSNWAERAETRPTQPRHATRTALRLRRLAARPKPSRWRAKQFRRRWQRRMQQQQWRRWPIDQKASLRRCFRRCPFLRLRRRWRWRPSGRRTAQPAQGAGPRQGAGADAPRRARGRTWREATEDAEEVSCVERVRHSFFDMSSSLPWRRCHGDAARQVAPRLVCLSQHARCVARAQGFVFRRSGRKSTHSLGLSCLSRSCAARI